MGSEVGFLILHVELFSDFVPMGIDCWDGCTQYVSNVFGILPLPNHLGNLRLSWSKTLIGI